MVIRAMLVSLGGFCAPSAGPIAGAAGSNAEQPPAQTAWQGTSKDGTAVTMADVRRILAAHAQWFKDSRSGAKADLSGADLHGIDLRKAFLVEVGLAEANLNKADLRWAEMERANLNRATLVDADLRGARLANATLIKVSLLDADLRGAQLIQANLGEAYLAGADLSGAELQEADLNSADLATAKLAGVKLHGADMRWARLLQADLRKADLSDAILRKADLREADLREANLDHAKLTGANLLGARMSGANLSAADLSQAVFDLEPGTLPTVLTIASASGLAAMRYERSPTSLIELREAFRTAGLRDQANEVHFAIMHTRRTKAGAFERIVLLAVEIPCAYGMRPGRPLLILLSAILLFWIPYIVGLQKHGAGGIWIIWDDDRAPKDQSIEKNARLSPSWFRRMGVALYFSVVSAFNIGWEEINIGSWIARLQPREFTLKAVGWVRVVAGVQSLFGVYLVALSILSYFGHLFE